MVSLVTMGLADITYSVAPTAIPASYAVTVVSNQTSLQDFNAADLSLQITGSHINVVPEPASTAVAAGLGSALMLGRRRGKR